MNKIKVLIVDDHKIILDGLGVLLHGEADVEIVNKLNKSTEVVPFIEQHHVDIVLLDISMPVIGGLELIPQIKKVSNTKILMLTMHDEAEYVLKAVKLGVDGYVLKNSDKSEIIGAIRSIIDGKKYYNNEIYQIIINRLHEQNNDETETINLSPREKDVLKLVCDGLSNKMIADELNISSRTVETHRNNLLRKFEVSNTAELVKNAFEKGLISTKK